ncbi:MAG: hypothetical protein ACTTGX_05415 [Candidatus Cryptobacteroides sp.]
MKRCKFFILLLAFLVFSCQSKKEENIISPKSDGFYGHYILAAVNWQGSFLDLDEDGVGHYDVLQEFMNISGYDEYSATVRIGPSPAYIFRFALPYPVLNSEYHCTQMAKLNMNIAMNKGDIAYGGSRERKLAEWLKKSNIFLSGVKYVRIALSKSDTTEFKVYVYCSLPIANRIENKIEMHLDYLVYTFVKESTLPKFDL